MFKTFPFFLPGVKKEKKRFAQKGGVCHVFHTIKENKQLLATLPVAPV